MTTPFKAPAWQGATVAVLASGPSLTQEVADSVKHLPRIAVRRAFRLAPDADLVLALDGPPNFGFWAESEGFAGIRVCGVECDLDAMYANIPHERATLGPGHQIEVRNNGLAAIRLAAMCGAAKIVLIGFDPEPFAHFYGAADSDWDKYPGLTKGLAALCAELRAKGVEVEGDPKPAAVLDALPDYTNPDDTAALIDLIASINPLTVAEFGCNAGRTAAAILRAVPSITSYIGVDAEQGHQTTLTAQRNEVPAHPGVIATDDPRFQLVTRPRGTFDLLPADLPQCDAVFIDGDHSRDGVLNDYALAKAIVQPGGVIVFHDDNGRADMQVTETLAELRAGGANIEHVDGTWLAYERISAPKRKARNV